MSLVTDSNALVDAGDEQGLSFLDALDTEEGDGGDAEDAKLELEELSEDEEEEPTAKDEQKPREEQVNGMEVNDPPTDHPTDPLTNQMHQRTKPTKRKRRAKRMKE
eukprot:gnl/MRDRNA2_/MRDRNA2_65855_c0_seq1.p1 gnl/MRDRNA2_/MRDRNA2_65855_c0~~gnl/MRDRNA2_/MRDRNA2_65855_c0_seq1.p1  ORF type:complete len:106 (-),score=29.41 gnl/MRDRNA2_/MRDRNA2_65855_c0_seq1:3-320(-)